MKGMLQLNSPHPLFDALTHFGNLQPQLPDLSFANHDFTQAQSFLEAYCGSAATFNTYRREVEKLLQWSWHITQKSIKDLRRADIEAYLFFCQNPPLHWIGTKKVPRFIEQNGMRVPNVAWRPFVATVSKSAHRKGAEPNAKNYALSNTAFSEIFGILSSFYNYLIQENYTEVNPILQIRQKSKFIQKQQGKPKIRRLTKLQWQYVIQAAELLAARQPELHERTLFMMHAFYTMYLRISELAASTRWTPKMCDFYRDGEGRWWFTTLGKGNKQRDIAVSDAMLEALKRWRQYLRLSALPSPADNSPLLPKTQSHGPISSTTYIREIVQTCFDEAIFLLKEKNLLEEAELLNEVTVHWLRHTGISDDIQSRPREHVRDDAGHSSGAITDKYIDVEMKERHRSAKHKPIL